MKAAIFWITSPWTARLGIMARPRGGDWLDDEVRSWVAEKVDVVVSALTSEEVKELDVASEQVLCHQHGLEFVSLPIEDRSVPPSMKKTLEILQDLEGKLGEGKSVVSHCRQGIGRAALLAACLLVLAGIEPKVAVERITAARGVPVPETAEQRLWIERFSRELAKKA